MQTNKRARDAMFARPTADEIDAASRIERPGDRPTGAIIIPVPSDAPPMNWKHPVYGAPTDVWAYRLADGQVAWYAARVEYKDDEGNPKKDVLPVCLLEMEDGRKVWRSRAMPPPRPLYLLPELLSRRAAPILVVEGEKTADAAKLRLPTYAVTTSSGGCDAPDKSDWSLAAGHHVLIFPDQDDAGRRYARKVARLALAAGAASVRIVDVPRDWPEGWDLADPLPAGCTDGTIVDLLEQAPLFTGTDDGDDVDDDAGDDVGDDVGDGDGDKDGDDDDGQKGSADVEPPRPLVRRLPDPEPGESGERG